MTSAGTLCSSVTAGPCRVQQACHASLRGSSSFTPRVVFRSAATRSASRSAALRVVAFRFDPHNTKEASAIQDWCAAPLSSRRAPGRPHAAAAAAAGLPPLLRCCRRRVCRRVKQMVELAHTYLIEYLTNKRAELADRIFDDEVVHKDVVWDPTHPTVGVDGMKHYLADLQTAFPDFWVEVGGAAGCRHGAACTGKRRVVCCAPHPHPLLLLHLALPLPPAAHPAGGPVRHGGHKRHHGYLQRSRHQPGAVPQPQAHAPRIQL